ncbi:MAG: LysR substrate-binding domain-containing protein, partial [Pseudomonadota bacterium]
MDLKRFRLFVALAEELHFGRAARRSGVTQSVLSTQIRRLEDEVGAALFARSTRAVRLTPVGREFLAEARDVLERVAQAARVARSLAAGKRRALRVGLTTVAMMGSAPARLAAFRAAHPDVDLHLREIGTVDQEAALAARELDVGFLHPPVDHPELAVRPLAPSGFVALRRAGQGDAAAEGPVEWRAVLREPLVFYGRARAPRLHDRLIASAQALGVSPRIVCEARSFLAAAASAAAG